MQNTSRMTALFSHPSRRNGYIRRNGKSAVLCFTMLLLTNVLAAQSPSPPDLSRELASRLPALARQAMLHYLENRNDARNISIPAALRESQVVVEGKKILFAQAEFPVILTLRHKGQPVSRCVHHGEGIVQNVIVAALQAMRSSTLPDHISRAYLESLTIELEIVGKCAPIEEERLSEDLRTGLDGLKLTVGIDDPKLQGPHFQDVYQEAVVSPATAYVLGWDALLRMKKQCLMEIRWRAENRSLRRQWSRFATLHYVTYPDKPAAGAPTGTWLLYRGKILTRTLQFSDTDDRRATAKQVGDFLLRHQDESGQYTLPSGKASTTEQLHAAWAMAKLGTVLKEGKSYTGSAQAALGYIAKQYVKLDPEGKRASVFTTDPKQEVLATAMFILAAEEDSPSEASRAVEANMLAFLRSRMDEEGHFLDAAGKRVDDVSAAVSLLAMQTLQPNPADEPWRDGVEALLYDAGEMGADEKERHPLSAAGEAWLGLAILAGKCGSEGQYRNFVFRFATRMFQSQRRDGAPQDEIGAICTSTGQPVTLPTALGVILLYQAIQDNVLPPADYVNYQACKAMNAGLSFCRQMLYRTEEAYFTPNPAAWRGGVRRCAASADVSLGACAGVIQAMLLK